MSFQYDKGALIEKVFRYHLWRVWDARKPCILFIMLNPSTAGADLDDNTIRRCIRFAYFWGYGGIHVVNLHAFRSKSPKELRKAKDSIGPRNDEFILKIAETIKQNRGRIVCAWGEHGNYLGRAEIVSDMLRKRGCKLYCLGLTQKGKQPRHPLYVRGLVRPQKFKHVKKSVRGCVQ